MSRIIASTRTYHHKDDGNALRFAGLMGHEFACVASRAGLRRRELVSETNSPERAKSYLSPAHTDAAIYRKYNGNWHLYEIVD